MSLKKFDCYCHMSPDSFEVRAEDLERAKAYFIDVLATEGIVADKCDIVILEVELTPEECLDWIDRATYAQLLAKVHQEPTGSPFFKGGVGREFMARLGKTRLECTEEELKQATRDVEGHR